MRVEWHKLTVGTDKATWDHKDRKLLKAVSVVVWESH